MHDIFNPYIIKVKAQTLQSMPSRLTFPTWASGVDSVTIDRVVPLDTRDRQP
jgi:hypothetical protein